MKRKNLICFGFGIYLLLLVWLILFKLEPRFWQLQQTGRSMNLIPFARSMLQNGRISISEIAYNALFFVPLGIYLSVLDITDRAWKRVMTGFLASIAFEGAQYLFAIGASDITDVIMNTLGTALGVLIGIKLKQKEELICTLLLIAELLLLAGYIALLAMQ